MTLGKAFCLGFLIFLQGEGECAMWLAGSQFSDLGSNPGPPEVESQSPNH